MLGIRHPYVRSILAVIAFAFLSAAVFLAQNTAATVALLVLFIASVLSWINPPGIFGWLIQGVCPYCDGHVVWEVRQEPEPYHEQIVVRCEKCGRTKVQFAYHPQ
jgi:hypothetical protein